MKTSKMTKTERAALIRVRNGLRDGKFVHRANYYHGRASKKPLFNMGTIGLFQNTSCGSVGCIGGWVEQELGRSSRFATQKARPLCYPNEDADWERITPKQAVKAIDNFLKDGDPRWASVVPRDNR